MKKLLLFGGTSEERGLIEALALYPVAITLCVASVYGRARWPEEDERLSVYAGRIDAKQMAELTPQGRFFLHHRCNPSLCCRGIRQHQSGGEGNEDPLSAAAT